MRLLSRLKTEKTVFANSWARRKTPYLCYIYPLLTKGAQDWINPVQAYRIYRKLDDRNPGKCTCLIAQFPLFPINDFNRVIKPFSLKCTNIKQTFAIAFAQLQLSNKPFPIRKCSNHSCVVALEAISGCSKCRTEAHLEIYNVVEHFSCYLLAEQFLLLLLPFPNCSLFQPGILPPLHPAGRGHCPPLPVTLKTYWMNLFPWLLMTRCCSVKLRAHMAVLWWGTLKHICCFRLSQAVSRCAALLHLQLCSLLLQGRRWRAGLLWLHRFRQTPTQGSCNASWHVNVPSSLH